MSVVTQVALPLILAFLMFSMGLSLVPDDFRRVSDKPLAYGLGFALQVVALPLLAVAIAWLFHSWLGLSPTHAAGLVILAACPGGVISNMLTHLSRGDTALSISLTATISLLSVVTVPFVANLGLATFLGPESQTTLNVLPTVAGIFAITTLPVAAAMSLKHWREPLADRLDPPVRKVAAVLFAALVIGAIAKDFDLLVEAIWVLGPAVLTLNLAAMGLAALVSTAAGLPTPQGRALTFECGTQSAGLAMFITLTVLGSDELMAPSAVYAVVMTVTAALWMGVLWAGDRRSA